MPEKAHLSVRILRTQITITVKQKAEREIALKRINKKVIAFNSKELKAIDFYCKKYRVGNKTKFMREAIITHILKKFDQDYPTLWDGQLTIWPYY